MSCNFLDELTLPWSSVKNPSFVLFAVKIADKLADEEPDASVFAVATTVGGVI